MNIYEQLTQTSKQLENVRETLTHRNEMQPWEAFEYETLEQIYLAKIAELNGFIAELENKLYATKIETPVSGYTVEVVSGENIAYKLHGTRGATYRLIRHINHPELMFAINSVGNVVGIKGNYTFIDEGGPLRPYYGE